MATQTETQTETSQVAPINGVPQSKTALKVVFGAMTLGKEDIHIHTNSLTSSQRTLHLTPVQAPKEPACMTSRTALPC